MSILAEANQVKFSMFEESAFGVIATGNKLTDVRIRSENLKQDTDTTQNDELRFDRQRNAPIRTGLRANGGFEFLFSYGSHDFLWEALLLSGAWSAPVVAATAAVDVSVVGATKTYSSVAGWSAVPTANDWVLFVGFGDAVNNGLKKVVSADANDIVVEQTCADEAAGASVTITQGAGISNGTTKRSFSAEANYTDIAAATLGKFRHHTGLMANTGELNVQANGLVSGSFGFLGARELSAASTAGDGSNTVASTTQPMNAIDHVTAVLENGQSIDLSDFTFRLNNNLAERIRIGSLGAFDIRAGTVDVEGTLEGYYEDSILIDKYLNWDDTSLVIQFRDIAGNRYLIEIPRCKFTDGTRNASGINTDIKSPLTWSAFGHETEQKTIKWYRWAA